MVFVNKYTYSFSGIFAVVAVSNIWTGVKAQDDGFDGFNGFDGFDGFDGSGKKKTSILFVVLVPIY